MGDMHYRTMQAEAPLTYEQANLVLHLRLLMSRLAYLSRFYIIERITGVGNTDDITERILRIPAEMNEIAESIGLMVDFNPVTLRYTAALQELVDAMVAGDEERADAAIQRLYTVSDENAAYLAQANPHWDEAEWRRNFYRFNEGVVAEVIAIQARDFDTALDVFDALMVAALARGDYYAQGFIPFMSSEGPNIPPAYFNMVKDFRRLLTQWAYLMRFYIVSRVSGLGNTQYVAQRLYNLPSQFQQKFELILGPEVATYLLNALLIYIVRLEMMIDTALTGDQSQIAAAREDARRYADELVEYLNSVNPYWDEEEGRGLFYALIDILLELSYVLQSEDDIGDMETFERLLDAALATADYLALGLYEYTLINAGSVPAQE